MNNSNNRGDEGFSLIIRFKAEDFLRKEETSSEKQKDVYSISLQTLGIFLCQLV